ncbi:MAG: hypothetical protein QS721_08515 [Candidatus Endonucleobacter sp. (ex Gigantidas childressi)]|nr:hypothetical protein [Candidatus Endonucleobacter sp. (ex Gigantidas childressi)]
MTKKRGSSNTDERIAVMERVLNLIPIKRIDNLLTDREFIGHEWLDWLRQNKLSCRTLVKSNNVVEHRSKKPEFSPFIFRNLHTQKLFMTLNINGQGEVNSFMDNPFIRTNF